MVFLLTHTIDRSAERFPDHHAFRIGGRGLTYEALVQQANSLARVLRENGVKRGDRVGVYMHKCLESAVAIFGIMKAGAAYVPLDPMAPALRLRYVLNHCGIRHLVTHRAKEAAVPALLEAQTPLTCVIGCSALEAASVNNITWEEVYNTPGEAMPDNEVMEADLAYVMYTSGSTGDPKGIMHTHRSGLSYAKLAADTYGLHQKDRISGHAPLHFDISTLGYFATPLVGATTVLIPEAYAKLPASLSKLIQDEHLTVWYSVPYALIQLLLRGVIEQRDLKALRWVLFGGEPFPPKYVRALMKKLPGARFSNVYGPAEVNQCTFYHVPPLPDDIDEPIPLGHIWANTQGLVVDEEDRLVAAEEAGELLIRTPTMMQGYWGRPDLNERAFYRRTPFANYEEVFYRTGDLVQQRADGILTFLGRKDRQIKTRGFRVELDEVEAVLLSHVQVEEAAVYGVPDGEGSQQIEAAVILHPESSATPDDLIGHMGAHLSGYAVPARIVLMDVFPRTTSGKINRRALQERAVSVITLK